MFRTSRTYRRGREKLTWLGEWRLSGPERRDVGEAARRAAIEAERQREGGAGGPLHGAP